MSRWLITYFKTLDRMDPIKLKEMKTQLDEFLHKEFIRLSVLTSGAQVLLVLEKEGTLRLCIDCRELNKTAINNKCPSLE